MSDEESRKVTPTLSITITNRRSEIVRLSEFVEQFAAVHHLSSDDALAVNLVLDEIAINVIRHGYDDDREHDILIVLTLDGSVLTIQVEDDGRPFNPMDAPAPDLTLPVEERPLGGLGIHLVRMSVDDMAYRRDGDRNVLTMHKTVGTTGRTNDRP
jgi:anti-sigma regulatory factor (Ser/Thr protein kinase)